MIPVRENSEVVIKFTQLNGGFRFVMTLDDHHGLGPKEVPGLEALGMGFILGLHLPLGLKGIPGWRNTTWFTWKICETQKQKHVKHVIGQVCSKVPVVLQFK